VRLAKIPQKSGVDVHVNLAKVVTVGTDQRTGETVITLDDQGVIKTSGKVADIINEIDAAMK
jgi:hypothetical protein